MCCESKYYGFYLTNCEKYFIQNSVRLSIYFLSDSHSDFNNSGLEFRKRTIFQVLEKLKNILFVSNIEDTSKNMQIKNK